MSLIRRSALITLVMALAVFACAESAPELVASVSLERAPLMITGEAFTPAGTLSCNMPVDALEASVINELTLEIEQSARADIEGGATTVSLAPVLDSLELRALSPGEKTLVITAYSGGRAAEAGRFRFTRLGTPGEHAHITKKLNFTMRLRPKVFWNNSYYRQNSWYSISPEDCVLIELPQGQSAKAMIVEWLSPPDSFLIECLGGAGEVLFSYEPWEGYSLYADTFALGEDVRAIRIYMHDSDSALSALRVYASDGPDVDIQDWQPLEGKLDLMLVSTHQDDELLFFGGAIPHYTAAGSRVGVVYMANCGRPRVAEALSGLWIAGLREHPVLLNFKDATMNTYANAAGLWGGMDNIVGALVAQIRKYKPEVIVTHGSDGEYGFLYHIITSDAVREAVRVAADADAYPDSAREYGVWQVKKLYLHEGDGLTMDWNVPLSAFDGRTARQMSEIAYQRHASQVSYLPYTFGLKYDPSRFTLVFTSVGEDVRGGDFLENTPAALADTALTDATPAPPDAAELPDPPSESAPSIEIFGRIVSAAAAEIDLSGARIPSVDALRDCIKSLPALKKLIVSDCGLPDEALAALRSEFCDIEIVWTLYFGKWSVRTDATAFSTLNDGSYRSDSQTFMPLKYCANLLALDLGHNSIRDLSFLEGLTGLRYLILADNKISDISALKNMRELEYVELFFNRLTNIDALADMPKLVDLNLCFNQINDYSALATLPGLERLWFSGNGLGGAHRQVISAYFDNCEIDFSTDNAVGGGWRTHPRYQVIKRVFNSGVFEPF